MHRLAQRRHRCGGLVDREHALRQREFDAVPRLRPGEQRIPRRRLFALQRGIAVVAVAEKVGLGIGGDGFGKGRAVARRQIDRGVGDAGHRHRCRVDVATLRIPFGGDRFGELLARHHQRGARGGAHRAPVKRDAPAAVLRDDRRSLPEAFHGAGGVRQRRARMRGMIAKSNTPVRTTITPIQRSVG